MGKAVIEIIREGISVSGSQNVPAIIKWTCPECGEECEMDLSKIGLPKHLLCSDELIMEKIKLWCHVCDYTAMVRGAVKVTLELVSDELVEYE